MCLLGELVTREALASYVCDEFIEWAYKLLWLDIVLGCKELY